MRTDRGASIRDDVTSNMAYSSAEKAGDVARIVMRANPGTRVGIKSCEFGPMTVAYCIRNGYGDVLWMQARQLFEAIPNVR